jgi:hypothetical protein
MTTINGVTTINAEHAESAEKIRLSELRDLCV